MKHQISVLDTCQRLLDRYIASVHASPNKVSEESEDLAYAMIYLVNRYADEFMSEKWMDVFRWYSDQISEIETYYRDMVVFQAPLWCCMYRLERSECHLKDVLDYGLSQGFMGRMIYLDYAYLIRDVIDHLHLLRYVKWYCKEGKFCVDPLLYLFMNSCGTDDEKLVYLHELYADSEVRKYPQLPGAIEPYINKEFVSNPFSFVDQSATNIILDFILFKDLTMTKQLEIDLSKVQS